MPDLVMTVEIRPDAPTYFRRDAAGDDLLFLDDLGVQVGAERAGDRVGDVDAFEVVEVVGRRRRCCRRSSLVLQFMPDREDGLPDASGCRAARPEPAAGSSDTNGRSAATRSAAA